MTGDSTGEAATGAADPLEPDVVVRTALQLLPIPSHGDDFWEHLEAALDAEPPLEMPVEPVQRAFVAEQAPDPAASAPLLDLEPDHSLAVVPPAFRRTSNAVLAAVAAAAVVIVGIAGSTLLEERQGTTTSSGPAPSAALETLMSDAQSDGATVTTISAAHQDASSDAVLAWVDDLGNGDADAAWAAMGDSSQAHFGSQAEFESLMTDLAEGYGAWSAADPADVQVTPVSTDDDGTIAVITLIGAVQQEGSLQERADAFPVRILDGDDGDGDVVLEPFASAGDLEVAIPAPIPEPAGDDVGYEPGYEPGYEQVGTGEELVFVLPGDAEAPVLHLDGGDTVICGEADGTELSDLDQSTGQRCAYLPEGGFGVGPHTVTIAFLGPDGDSITAESLRFEAA